MGRWGRYGPAEQRRTEVGTPGGGAVRPAVGRRRAAALGAFGSHYGLLAAAVDRLSLLLWSRTKDALHGHNRPASVLALLMGDTKPKKSTGFATAEEYEAARQAILRG